MTIPPQVASAVFSTLWSMYGKRIIKKVIPRSIAKPRRHESNNYGLYTTPETLEQMAQRIAFAIDGGGDYADTAVTFMLEIANVESKAGTYWDKTKYAGMGICQVDKIGFEDTVNRTTPKVKEKVLDQFGVDIDAMNWEELRHSPFLSLLICRLFILLRPGKIPATVTGRATYWKKFYNTSKGKGTEEHYIMNCKGKK